MSDLVTFIRARLGEKAAGAWAVHDVSRCDALLYEEDMAGAAARDPGCDCGWPARVLREVEAMRAIVDMHAEAQSWSWPPGDGDEAAQDTLRTVVHHLASIWRDHADYDPAWG